MRSVAEALFAVELETIGKAYSGLTDAERSPSRRSGVGFIPVRRDIVLEDAFDGLSRSDRLERVRAPLPTHRAHPRRQATRGGRHARPVRAPWEAQLASGHREDLVAADRKKPRGGRSGGRLYVRSRRSS
jgi:hypothetical protein